MHGDVAVSDAGEVNVSIEGSVRQRHAILSQNPSLQVHAPDGRFLRNVPGAPSDLHAFVIRQEDDGEFLYGVRLAGGRSPEDQPAMAWTSRVVVKMRLDGTIVMAIPRREFRTCSSATGVGCV